MNTTPGNFIDGTWTAGDAEPIVARDPATGAVVSEIRAASGAQIISAINSARTALEAWAERPFDDRANLLRRFAESLLAKKPEFAGEISCNTGKPLWEALTEVDAIAAKIAISIEAVHERRQSTERQQAGALAATRFKPMGVMAVIGPFNMPGHLPNGHIIPALLAGNTIVFKPSELTPGVGVALVQHLEAAGVPAGVVNLIQGGRDVGAALTQHPNVNGILFTGSVAGGMAIARSVVDHPGKILALEMGGNNPLVIWQAKDLDAVAYLTIQSAYITSGQRCSCARRLIVPAGAEGNAIVDRLIAMIRGIRVGPFTDRPEPFMGPVISDASAERLLTAQEELIMRGGTPLIFMRSIGERRTMLTPGLIDMTGVASPPDEEIFGPLLQLVRVASFEEAIIEANRTKFGLAAGLFSDDADLWKTFYRKIRAGVVYWNRQTTGGSSYLPFGGVGHSGNFRPSGYWAADYCSYPVASMEMPTLSMPTARSPGLG